MRESAKDVGVPDRLRAAIDSGEAGDKAAFPDPAAAPLGTDDEAAGTPNTHAQVARGIEAETARGPTGEGANAATPVTSATPPLGGSGRRPGGIGAQAPWLIAAGGVLFVIVLAILLVG